MRTRVELSAAPGQEGRLREVAALLVTLRDTGAAPPPALPRWLAGAFAPERTSAEAEAWLARWRAAPDPVAFQRASGWTAENWLHWFSPDNGFWSVGDVRTADGGLRLEVDLDHDDDPLPMEALRWLALTAGLRPGAQTRV